MRRLITIFLLFTASLVSGARAQAPGGFRWVDLHKEKTTVAEISAILDKEPYTAIREIGLIGESALVITAQREDKSVIAYDDYMKVFSISLASKQATNVMEGRNLQLRDWYLFAPGRWDLILTYQTCSECEITYMMTALHYDDKTQQWRALWPGNRGDTPGVLIRTQDVDPDFEADFVFSILDGITSPARVGSWSHYRNLKTHKQEEVVDEYWVDENTGKDEHRSLKGVEAAALELKLCKADPDDELSAGQNSAVCRRLLHPVPGASH